jgi:photosystem II oxygen-evolving enhancer protein 2
MAALRIYPAVHARNVECPLGKPIDTFSTTTKLSKSCSAPRRLSIKATISSEVEANGEAGHVVGRREVLSGVVGLAAAVSVGNGPALAVGKAPKGFSAVLDNADGYAFLYPFGWQEVAVKGQDVAFKDVIEPLESVSVSIVKTDKTSLEELGPPEAVAKALVEKVLSSPTQKTTLKKAEARVTDGKTYYQFEFTAEARNFTRHALGAVAVNGGKFYTLTTGANERRWNKIEEKLRQVVDSFTTL